jgi:hypothetical protein
MGKAFSVFMNMDKMVGGDFEKGLASLDTVGQAEAKRRAEEAAKAAAAAAAAPVAGQPVPGQPAPTAGQPAPTAGPPAAPAGTVVKQ